MAEESELKGKNSINENTKQKTYENGWIVCRSQKRPGLLYDFNTVTGEAVWRDPDKIALQTAIMDKNKGPFECHEPTEPPMEPKPCNQQNVTPSSSGPKIYNKPIINNQFPAKQYAIGPFGNPTCASYGLIDPNNSIAMNNGIGMNATPAVWVPAPTPQPVLLPAVTPLNQVQTLYGGLENLQMHNSSVTLSHRFQVLGQLNTGSPNGLNMQNEGSDYQRYNYRQPKNNVSPRQQRKHRKPVNNDFSRPTDLRSKLSSRRRLDLNATGNEVTAAVAEKPETSKKDAVASITEDDLNPDDNDEWLEAHTDGEGRELNVDIESFFELADSCASRDCCYIIPTTRVLLNHMRFLTSLVISDDRLRLLTPRDVVRALRSVAFADNRRLGDYASRARSFAIRQMRKIPDTLNGAPNIKSCLELIPPNIHVVRLVDEKDLNQESINDGTITISELKRYLSRTSNKKPNPVSKIQNICENIKITVPNDELKPDSQEQQCKDQVNESRNTINITAEASSPEAHKVDPEQSGVKEIEIQTDLIVPLGKLTVNACVQTDFDFPIALSKERPKLISQAINTADELCDKQTDCNFTVSEVRPTEVNNSQTVNTQLSNDSATTTVAPRKIRLKRQQPSTTQNTEEKKAFKWRKRKTTLLPTSSLLPNVEQCQQSSTITASSTCYVQHNDVMPNVEQCQQSSTITASPTCFVQHNDVMPNVEQCQQSSTITASPTCYVQHNDVMPNVEQCQQSSTITASSTSYVQHNDVMPNVEQCQQNSTITASSTSYVQHNDVMPNVEQCQQNSTITASSTIYVQHNDVMPNVEQCQQNSTITASSTSYVQHNDVMPNVEQCQQNSTITASSTSYVQHNDVMPNVEQCQQNSTITTPASSTSYVQHNDVMNNRHSDASVTAKMVDENSTSGVVSNSIESDTVFKINKQAIQNKSVTEQNIIVYEVTSDLMQDRLKVRCEEWMSRFVQIMEEVLSQVLLLEPIFKDATLPPPWSFYEATVCIKRKFAKEKIVADASDKLAMFLLKINDDRGNIEARISPTDFMQMYTYGVNLVNKLQLVLKDCEDLHIASKNLSNLLSDIRDPNIDESYDLEMFNDEPIVTSPNVSEAVTDITSVLGRQKNFPPVNDLSTKSKEKRISCNNSPARYSLRSSHSHSEQNKNQDECTHAVGENKEYTLFSSLGLQKRVNNCVSKPSSPLKQAHDIVSDYVQDGKENDDAKAQPKIIRNFSFCPEFEKKLQGEFCNNTELDQTQVENNDATDDANDNDDNNYAEDAHVANDSTWNHRLEDVQAQDDVDFAEDDDSYTEPYNYDNDCGGMLGTTEMDVDPSTRASCPLNANSVLKQVVRKLTYKYRRWLSDLQKFCEVTNAARKSPDYHQREYQANVTWKITKVAEHAKAVCHRLKCILDRDPNLTSSKFRDMIKSYGVLDCDLSDTQLAEYRGTIEKYLELAERLLTCVTRLAEAVKVK